MTYCESESAAAESVQEVLTSLATVINEAECSAMPEEVLAEYRKTLSKVQSKAKEGLAKTSRKELNFNEQEVAAYIDWVLQRGFALVETNPSDAPKLNDAQMIKRFKLLIKKRVKVSQFGESQFKITVLSVQRKNIESATSLHELRQSIKAMIPVLKLYRDHALLVASYDEIMDHATAWVSQQEHDAVLLELEVEQKLSADRKRVIDEMIDGLYKPSSEMSDEELLQAVDGFKKLHKCNDEEAACFYGTSRSTVSRLRSKLKGK